MNSVGVETVAKNMEWYLYPNPATTVITINISSENEPGNIKIYSTSGQLVYEQRIGQEQSEVSIDVSNFSAGMYTVMLQSGERVSTKKLIVK